MKKIDLKYTLPHDLLNSYGVGGWALYFDNYHTFRVVDRFRLLLINRIDIRKMYNYDAQ
jgi:hypothetical protein